MRLRRNILAAKPPCLPPGGHPRVASLAPLGQFTFRCQNRYFGTGFDG